MKKFNLEVTAKCFNNINYYMREEFGIYNFSENKCLRWLQKKYSAVVNVLNSVHCMKKNFDIIHPTYYHPYILGRCSGKLILTVHDMIHEKFADTYLRHDLKTVFRKRKMIRAADWIITISECTKRDLLYYYPEINPDKISVIYHGSSAQKNLNHDKKILNPEKYILFVGSRGGYKNFNLFVKAMNFILKRDKDLKILCVGGGEFNKKELELMGDNFSKFKQANLNDNELSDAYFNAQCFVYPSEYEGFGIPILEAFANNCPVVLSNASCFPEIASDAGEYFNPYDYQDMAEKIFNVINNNQLRNNLILKGLERLKNFSWDKTARETLECYNKALNS